MKKNKLLKKVVAMVSAVAMAVTMVPFVGGIEVAKGAGESYDTLINVSGTGSGCVIPTETVSLGTDVAVASVKYKTNTTTIYGINLGNGYTSNSLYNDKAIKLQIDGGFKAGDTITVAGVFNNSKTDRHAGVDLFSVDSEKKCTLVNRFPEFINGRLVNDEIDDLTYTLEKDYDYLYLGRSSGLTNATSTLLTKIEVKRAKSVVTTEELTSPMIQFNGTNPACRIVYPVDNTVIGKEAIGLKVNGTNASETYVGKDVYASVNGGSKTYTAPTGKVLVVVEITDLPATYGSFTVQPTVIDNGTATAIGTEYTVPAKN